MVSDKPGKGFIMAREDPLLSHGLTSTGQYDPSVFIDIENGDAPYIIFGAPRWMNADGYYIARLNDDMISLAESPKKIK